MDDEDEVDPPLGQDLAAWHWWSMMTAVAAASVPFHPRRQMLMQRLSMNRSRHPVMPRSGGLIEAVRPTVARYIGRQNRF
jgi:hypothetical protein